MLSFLHLHCNIESCCNDAYVRCKDDDAKTFLANLDDLRDVEICSLNGGDPEFPLSAIDFKLVKVESESQLSPCSICKSEEEEGDHDNSDNGDDSDEYDGSSADYNDDDDGNDTVGDNNIEHNVGIVESEEKGQKQCLNLLNPKAKNSNNNDNKKKEKTNNKKDYKWYRRGDVLYKRCPNLLCYRTEEQRSDLFASVILYCLNDLLNKLDEHRLRLCNESWQPLVSETARSHFGLSHIQLQQENAKNKRHANKMIVCPSSLNVTFYSNSRSGQRIFVDPADKTHDSRWIAVVNSLVDLSRL